MIEVKWSALNLTWITVGCLSLRNKLKINKIHVDVLVQFTYEIAKNNQMPFLDVWIDKIITIN